MKLYLFPRIVFSLLAVFAIFFILSFYSNATAAATDASDIQTSDTQTPDDEPDELKLSVGRENIVLRARQIYEIEWTPLRDVVRWNQRGHFKAGETVRGLPYGLPQEANYVPLKTSFAEFLVEVNDINSRFYTSYATRHAIAPYFSLDCSAFVSWAWGLENRIMTSSLFTVSENIGRDINKLQIGDALNKPGVHVVLITHLEHDEDNNVSEVGIMELYYPQAMYKLYGEDGDFPLNEVYRRYLNNDYTIIRFKDIENVVYLHDCAVPIDSDYCPDCFENEITPFEYPMTRGMALYSFFAMVNEEFDEERTSDFLDVPMYEWYSDAIAWAVDIGLIYGTESRLYPRTLITEEEMNTIKLNLINRRNTQLILSIPRLLNCMINNQYYS